MVVKILITSTIKIKTIPKLISSVRQYRDVTNNSNIKIIEPFRTVLHATMNAPFYARNRGIHRDLGMPAVKDDIKRFAKKRMKLLNVSAAE